MITHSIKGGIFFTPLWTGINLIKIAQTAYFTFFIIAAVMSVPP